MPPKATATQTKPKQDTKPAGQTLSIPGDSGSSGEVKDLRHHRICTEAPPTEPNKLRIWATGSPGVGKTCFFASNPDALVIDLDDSVRDVPPAHRHCAWVTPTSGQELMDLHADLCDLGSRGKAPHDHIVIDTIDKGINLGMEYLRDDINAARAGTSKRQLRNILELGDKGAGWQETYNWMASFLYDLYAAGYGWTLIGHVGKKFDPDDPNGRAEVLVTRKMKGLFFQESQMMLEIFRHTVEVDVPTGQMISRRVKGQKGKQDVPQTRKEEQHQAYVELGFVSAREVDLKARHLNLLPKFQLGRNDPLPGFRIRPGHGWGQLARSWTDACDKAAALELDDSPQLAENEVPW